MSDTSLTLYGTYLIVAGLLIIQPWFSRKNVLFGVIFASHSIWDHVQAASIRHRYLLSAGGTALAFFVILLLLPFFLTDGKWSLGFNVVMLALIVIDSFFYILANRQTRKLKQSMGANGQLTTQKIVVDLGKSDRETVLSLKWLFLLIPVFVATLAVVWFGYPYIADSIPTHFGISGPDRWAVKSWHVVLSPVVSELLLGVLILFTRRAPASVKGNPNAAPGYAQYRKMMNILLIVFCLLSEILFFLMVLSFITPIRPLWFSILFVVDLGFLIMMILLHARFVRSKHASGPILDDDGKWIWGIFYFNRYDPSIFVEKRVGIGFTVNMARPIAWIVLIGIIIIAIVFSR
ncbi:DUF5808 domain-containing protein [Sporolactobacillus shoreicorticis]|uniref:DUF5808 domain-containing protein n=1 Tax=Sporolactobacillus shoreicorticis TaxID=1923877 RepID=A0ABW5S023_9BACL|nr:DUF5808 domain-containing protein [Sporolactobacillus shoreicorticis]MCO7127233.1 DUF5808 domain-containing protein [Sporolactobacillus shoreicorticis]